ncbi:MULTISPECIES: hypothetical protein [Actinoalloteichus]|uniref:Uncharacterized protein n=1 Tax=Actinoalloteichus fjordicus TaxID=1612552 RepID=A0AAC9LD59_9PSEU|nr:MULTISPECIES: hypothetical protein [Actinoalloteichus]APU15451.1 hypothetical protein UA74_17105 [Actinoalloteichus fjordicus]APU21519.1 hypothetical protein UA75_17645 [Actinoalloteichus sp. GBA129-24]
MNRRSVLVPAMLAAGGLFLAACGQTESDQDAVPADDTAAEAPASGGLTEDSTPSDDGSPTDASGAADPTGPGEDGLEPVDCGEIELDAGTTHNLIALPSAGGVVGCTEAFNVIDEFIQLPDEEKAEAALGNVELSDGWSCTIDDGATAGVGCVQGQMADDFEFAFQTQP